MKNTKQLTGAAGVYYVASELSMRGLVALPTNRNSKGPDVIVTDQEGKHSAFLQVKTSQSKVTFWPVGSGVAGWTGDNCYYAFVRRSHGRFEAFLEKATIVARESAAADRAATERGNRQWAPWWPMTGQDATKGAEERTRKQWEEFSL